jgi:hypothetical protein
MLAFQQGGFGECVPASTPTTTATTTPTSTTATTSVTTSTTATTTATTTLVHGKFECKSLHGGTQFLHVAQGSGCATQAGILGALLNQCGLVGGGVANGDGVASPVQCAVDQTFDLLAVGQSAGSDNQCDDITVALQQLVLAVSGTPTSRPPTLGCAFESRLVYVAQGCDAVASAINTALDTFLVGVDVSRCKSVERSNLRTVL